MVLNFSNALSTDLVAYNHYKVNVGPKERLWKLLPKDWLNSDLEPSWITSTKTFYVVCACTYIDMYKIYKNHQSICSIAMISVGYIKIYTFIIDMLYTMLRSFSLLYVLEYQVLCIRYFKYIYIYLDRHVLHLSRVGIHVNLYFMQIVDVSLGSFIFQYYL